MKRVNSVILGSALAACLLPGSNASATPIAYASISGTVINFDSLTGSPVLGLGEILAGQFSGLGVTFNVPNFNAYATNGVLATSSTLNTDPNVIWVDQGGGGGGASALGMNIDFSTPQSRVGVLFLGSLNSTFTLAVYSGATLLESLTSSLGPGASGTEGFLALENSDITRAVVYSTNSSAQNWNFSIDDLKFDGGTPVPEPTTLLLLGGGLVGLVARRRRA